MIFSCPTSKVSLLALSSMADSMEVFPRLLLSPSTFKVVSSTGPLRRLDFGVDTGVVVTIESKHKLIQTPLI